MPNQGWQSGAGRHLHVDREAVKHGAACIAISDATTGEPVHENATRVRLAGVWEISAGACQPCGASVVLETSTSGEFRVIE
jgi:hypothetical protein